MEPTNQGEAAQEVAKLNQVIKTRRGEDSGDGAGVELQGFIVAGDREEIGPTVRNQMQNFLVRSRNAERKLAKC